MLLSGNGVVITFHMTDYDNYVYAVVINILLAVDSRQAGPGNVTVEVHGHRTKSQPRAIADGRSASEVTFRTIEGGPHKIHVFFNRIPVPGSPFSAKFFYGNIFANWEQLQLIPARKAATFMMDPRGATTAEVAVRILGE